MRILSLHVAVPPFQASQAALARFMARVLSASGEDRALALLERVFAGSGIATRRSVVPDFGLEDPAGFQLFPGRWDLEPFPGTAERMLQYERSAAGLAAEAANGALAASSVSPLEVTHLIVCTCTGFFAPGPEVELVRRLGLRPTVARMAIGFMGCHAGFNGLRAAEATVRSDGKALVLLVCVELCSLHYQKRPVPDLIVANALFADGAAAAVCGSGRRFGRGILGLARAHSMVAPDGADLMGWRIGDTGFEMRLDARVPQSLRRVVPAFVGELLCGLPLGAVSAWAVHPGGRKIVEAVGAGLGLLDDDLEPSLAVLREFGNMSSPSVFFVIERVLRRGPLPGPLVAVGFGPGLTLEGAVLEP